MLVPQSPAGAAHERAPQAGNPKEQYLLLRALNETIVSLAGAQAGASAAQLTPNLQDQVGCL